MVSAVAASVMSSGAWVPAKSSPTRAAADWSSAPTTMRSGWRLSGTAVPSRRNSGLETTVTSVRPRTRSTTSVEPTGTVDLLTMIVPGPGEGRSPRPRPRRRTRSADPSVALGSGHAQEDELRPLYRGRGADHEPQAAGFLPFRHQLLEVVLDDGHPALLQHRHFGRVGVATGHPVAQVGQGGRRGNAHVADADDGHRAAPPVGQDPHGRASVTEGGARRARRVIIGAPRARRRRPNRH